MTDKAQAKQSAPPENGIPIRVLCCLLSLIAIITAFVFGRSPVPSIYFSAMDGALLTVSIWLCIGGNMVSYYYRQEFPKALKIALNTAAALIAANLARELWINNINAETFEFLYPLVNTLIITSVATSFDLRTRNDILVSATFGLSLMALSGCSGRSALFGAAVLLYIIVGGVLLLLIARSSSSTMHVVDSRLVSAQCRGRYRPALFAAAALLPILSLAAFSFVPRIDIQMDNFVTGVRSATAALLYNARNQRAMNNSPLGSKNFLAESPPNIKAHKPDEFKEHGSWKQPEQKMQPPPPVHPPVPPTPPQPNKRNKEKGAPAVKPPENKISVHTPPVVPPPGLFPAKQKPGHIPRRHAAGVKAPSPVLPKTQQPVVPPQQPKSNNAAPNQLRNNKNTAETKAGDSRPHGAGNPAAKPSQPAPASAHSSNKSKSPAATAAATPKSKSTSGAANKSTANPAAAPDDGKVHIETDKVDLHEPMSESNTVVLTLSCNRNVYLRVMAYDDFDGRQWTRANPTSALVFNATLKGVDVTTAKTLQITDAMPVMELAEKITLKSVVLNALPVGGVAKRVSLLCPVIVDDNGNLELTKPLTTGASYTAICDWPVLSLADMRKSPSLADTNDKFIEGFLRLPKNQSRELVMLAARLTANGANRFQQAENIVQYLRSSCRYGSTPATDDPEANCADAFLFDTKYGDCKAYATAFCALCRAAGIPARYVSGFEPGEFDPVSGATIIRAKNAHAWAEIYMEPYGWIPFDPTPGGMLPSRPEQQYYNYQEIKRQANQYAATTGKQYSGSVETVLHIVSMGIMITGGLLAIGLAICALLILRGFIAELIAGMRQYHAAKPLRKRVLKQLSRVGLVEKPSDTGADLVNRLEELLTRHSGKPPANSQQLRQSVAEFFTTYNAVVFGRSTDLDGLKALALSIEQQLKSN